MTWKISNTPIDPDPYYGAVSLLLHGDGANGSTNIIDSSLNPKTVTAVGNAQISTAQSKFGGASIAFDNGNDYLVPASSTDLILGSTWTVECWWYLNSVGSGTTRNALLLSGGLGTVGALGIYQETGGFLNVRAGGATSDVRSSNGSIIALQWQHIAISVLNNVATIYIDGVQDGSGPINGPITASVSRIGSIGLLDYDTNGYIDDLRITKGVARYTSNFTPPSRPFYDFIRPEQDPYFYATSLLLHGDGTNGSTNVIDSSSTPKTVTAFGNAQISTAQSKFGGASLAFDGSGDYIVCPASSFVASNTETFTVELWAYWGSTATTQKSIISNSTGSAFGFAIQQIDATYKIGVNLSGDGFDMSSTDSFLLNAWNHIALCGTPGSPGILLFLNGVQQGSAYTGAVNLGSTTANVYVGRIGALNAVYFNGYIDDLRITKGIARYTSNFTPPTRAFPDF